MLYKVARVDIKRKKSWKQEQRH